MQSLARTATGRNDVAPIWAEIPPIWTATMMPNGIDTRIVGSSETRLMNHICRKNSSHEKRRLAMSSAADREAFPASRISRPVVSFADCARSHRRDARPAARVRDVLKVRLRGGDASVQDAPPFM